jgi:glycosyltransferase involved in cell wall biosynthesis
LPLLHVAQVSFFTDPEGREPEQLLQEWPTLGDVAEAAAGGGVRVSVIQASTHSCSIIRNDVHYSFLPFGFGAPARTGDRALATLLHDLDPQVLHVHGLGFAPDVVQLAEMMPGIPILLQDHADYPPRRWRRADWRRGFEVASGLAFCSLAQARPFASATLLPSSLPVYEVPESTSRFVPGDREAARRSADIYGDPLILWVGNLNSRKDPLTVLAGIREAMLTLPALQLWLCFGSAPLLPQVQRRIAGDPMLRERVHLLGKVPHARVEGLMRAADAFVLGSHREGSGYAVIEALACGLAPVVTDIPSFRTLTGGGRVGALWPCGDTRKMCAALLSTVARPRDEAVLAVRAQFDAEISLDALGRKLRLVYEDLVRRQRPAAFSRLARRTTWSSSSSAAHDEAVLPAPSRGQGRPLVSIILATFNRLHYLRATVDSIVRQSLWDWELLLVDDGSELETRAYLRALEDSPRFRVIWLPHTGNPAAVRNAALQQAEGEFVAFIDSDDLWMPEKLALQVGALQSRGGCDWCYTGFAMVDGAGRPLTGARALSCPAVAGWIHEPLLNMHAIVVLSSVLARRSLIEAVDGFDDDFWVCEEYELWLRLAQRSEVAFIDAPLVHVRRHQEHYADDVTSCEDLERMFNKLRHSDIAERSMPTVRRRRAVASAVLARSYATNGARGHALGKLLTSFHYGWSYPEWWRRGLATAAVALAPMSVKRLWHQRRHAPALAAGPQDP